MRGPSEPVDWRINIFYNLLLRLLSRPIVRDGEWQLLECTPAWENNVSYDAFIAYAWHSSEGERLLVTVNFAPHQSQCYVRLPFSDLDGKQWKLRDMLGDAIYDREGKDLHSRGLYLDVPAWHCHIFEFLDVTEESKKVQAVAV